MPSRPRTTRIAWSTSTTPTHLRSILAALAEEYPIAEGRGDIRVQFERRDVTERSRVSLKNGIAVVEYHTSGQAMRAVSALMAGAVADGGSLVEKRRFDTFGIMLDCSRNAVMTVEHLRTWLRRLALLGYNMAMLYTEDTYRLEGETRFGYMRGAYTPKELRQIDAYAARLGIEMVPCIQTLGHLAQILKWGEYRTVKDTGSVLLVGEKKTYELIDTMVAHWKSVYRTRRIHVGMDEAWDLGRGAYMNRNGYTAPFDLFNRHLARVNAICRRHGFAPMIWSDMYFSIASKGGGYYDRNTVIPSRVARKIPRNVQLVYWDYYHEQRSFYLDYIRKHRAMGFDPVMASGVWTWSKFWYDRTKTEAAAGACIDACSRAGVREILFTLWGDNGAYCDFDSALAGLSWVAEKSFARGAIDPALLAKRYAAVCKGDFAAHQRASDLNGAMDPSRVMWEDPLIQNTLTDTLAARKALPAKAIAHFARLAKDLARHTSDLQAGDLQLVRLYAQLLSVRLDLDLRLRTAYAHRDRRGLERVRKNIPVVCALIDQTSRRFRAMWLAHNKPFGIETIQGRYATLKARYQEVADRIGEFLDGAVPAIEELDECRRVRKR